MNIALLIQNASQAVAAYILGNAYEVVDLRGQISAEALLLLVIFLSLLGISLAASNRIGQAIQAKIEFEKSSADFRLFLEKLDSACRLGSGNVRVVELSGSPAAITLQNKTLHFQAGNFSGKANPNCQIILETASPSKEFIIQNKDGILEIR
ncbi:MAG: hypothetical protein QW275_00340 [Candidatus Anstonellaceae archaeon]